MAKSENMIDCGFKLAEFAGCRTETVKEFCVILVSFRQRRNWSVNCGGGGGGGANIPVLPD